MTGRLYGEDSEIGSWINAYTEHQRYSESPMSFHFWAAVSAVAAALGRKVWIDQRHFQWTPNMYIILVGPPGVAAKSTSMRGALSLLENVEGVRFGPQSMTWQALIKSFKDAQQSITISATGEPVTMSCLTIAASELGTFLRPENREFLDFLTALWDGQKETYRRRTAGEGEVIIHNPWLNVIGCTTPAWLKDNFPDVLIGGGLTSRIVFVFGDKKRQLIPYPSDLVQDDSYQEEELCLLEDLKQIAEMKGEYKLNDDAKAWGSQWYIDLNKQGLPAHLASGRFDGYIARKQSHVHKLAMVLAASKRSALTITGEDLRSAERTVTELERDMITVFNSIGVNAVAKTSSEVLTLIRNHKVITNSALWKACFQIMDMKTYKESLEGAIAAGHVRKEALGSDWKLTYVGAKR